MKIDEKNLYENRTWRYIYPCLKYYGKELMNELNSFFKLGVGIKDLNDKDSSNNIYILFNVDAKGNTSQVEKYRENFDNFLKWLSYKDYYSKDYPFDMTKHMVVLKIPKIYHKSTEFFRKGEYSKMYSPNTIERYFTKVNIPKNKPLEIEINSKLSKTKKILNKDFTYLEEFISIVNKDFNTNVNIESFFEAELDYPPKKEEEFFNYEEKEV